MPLTSLQAFLKNAARAGDIASVREALQHGLNVCGGADGGVDAFVCAAEEDHTEVLDVLCEAGVRDTGEALMRAISLKKRDSTMFLLKQYERDSLNHVNNTRTGVLLMFKVLEYFDDYFSAKLFRWLMDAGANTEARVSLVQSVDEPALVITARELVDRFKGVHSREECPALYLIDKLLKQEVATKALSWLWPYEHEVRAPPCKCTHIRIWRQKTVTSPVALRSILRYMRKTG